MSNSEIILNYLVRHRGEPEAEKLLNKLAMEQDDETVDNCKLYIYFANYDHANDERDFVAEFMEFRKQKHRHEIRRDRKIADNRKHYEKKKGAMVNV